MAKSLRELAEEIWHREHIVGGRSAIDTLVIAMERANPYNMFVQPIDPYAENPQDGGWEY